MKVFLSWSKRQSKEVAELLRDWLPTVLHSIEPWISEEDIKPGEPWSVRIGEKLSNAELGIIIVTRENLREQWLFFEAGAISKKMKTAHVIPLLLDVEPRELHPGPLSQFQSVRCNKEGISRLVYALNDLCKAEKISLPDDVLRVWFDNRYPFFSEKLKDLPLSNEVFDPTILSDLSYLKFSKRQECLFFDSIDYTRVIRIDILGHTGRNLVHGFLDAFCSDQPGLEERKEIEVRILLRNPGSELSTRGEHVKAVYRSLLSKFQDENFRNFHVNFYQSLPTFRSVILTTRAPDGKRGGMIGKHETNTGDQRRSGMIGYYHYPKEKPSKKYDPAIFFEETSTYKLELADVVASWFEHYWGKSLDKEIHTIIFDFDGTIADTYQAQIEAWLEALREVYKDEDRRSWLKSDVRELLKDQSNGDQKQVDKGQSGEKRQSLLNSIAGYQFKHQDAREIGAELLELDKNKDIDKITWFESKRAEHRRRKTLEESDLFEDVSKQIERLSECYNLVIISATDEQIVTEFLTNKNIAHLFWYRFGKVEGIFEAREGVYNIPGIEKKTQLIQKVATLVGVPVDRMVMIGDGTNDYKVAQDIKMDFVEARLLCESRIDDEWKENWRATHSNGSIINDELLKKEGEPRFMIKHWSELDTVLKSVEDAKNTRRKKHYGIR